MTNRPRRSPVERRALHHAILLALSLALIAGFYDLARSPDRVWRLSFATAYASTALLSFVLVIGPWNVLRNRPNPVSSNIRRDIAVWGGAIGLLHLVVGLQVHLRGKMWQYFLYPPGQWRYHVPVRFDAFGLANYTGLGAGLVLALLLALSNDVSLRRLGSRRWKTLQRTNYVGMALIVVHGIVYQLMEKRTIVFASLFFLLIAGGLGWQWAGYRRTRQERSY